MRLEIGLKLPDYLELHPFLLLVTCQSFWCIFTIIFGTCSESDVEIWIQSLDFQKVKTWRSLKLIMSSASVLVNNLKDFLWHTGDQGFRNSALACKNCITKVVYELKLFAIAVNISGYPFLNILKWISVGWTSRLT